MPTRHEHEEDPIEEILRRAIHLEGAESSKTLRERMFSAADELGISHEAVLKAEQEYQLETARAGELTEYQRELRKGFFSHLWVYVPVNVFLIFVNIFSFGKDHEIWFPFPLLGWGIGLTIHAVASLSKKDWSDEGFQKWRAGRGRS